MVERKLVAAALTASIFSIVLGLFIPNPFNEQVVQSKNYFYNVISIIQLYLMYCLPVIVFYGVLTSMLSDFMASSIASKVSHYNVYPIFSGVFHLLFGLVLFTFGLLAAALFFVIDRLLIKHGKVMHLRHVLLNFGAALLVWGISLGVVWINDFLYSN